MGEKASDIEKILGLFPTISRGVIERDLNVTLNAESTVNRILDGTICHNPESDDDLPDLSHNTSRTQANTTNMNVSHSGNCYSDSTTLSCKTKVLKHEHSEVDSILLSDSESETEVLPITERLGLHSSGLTTQGKPSANNHTDSVCISSDEESNTKQSVKMVSNINKRGHCESIRRNFYSSGSEDDVMVPIKTSSAKPHPHGHNAMVTIDTEQRHMEPTFTANTLKTGNGGTKKRKLSEKEQSNHIKDAVEEKKRQKAIIDKEKEEKKRQKEEEKERKKNEREEKLKEKEMEALKKRTLREARKNATPKECMKFVTVLLDPGLLKFSFGAGLLAGIQEKDLRLEVQAQPLPNLITFWREVTELQENNAKQLVSKTREVVQDEILLCLPLQEFLQMVQSQLVSNRGLCAAENQTLRDHIQDIKSSLEERNVTLIVQGLEKYFRGQKVNALKGLQGSKKGAAQSGIKVNRLDVEEVLVDIQLHTNCNMKFVETDQEVIKTVLQYAKAIAEMPFKRDRLETGFTFHLESSGSVKVDKSGVGLARVWRQQLQQFKNVSAEVANAIMAAYPAPILLWEVYKKCSSEKEAQLLLQDLMVRRGYGVMESSRRVGKEMSRRLHHLLTSSSPQSVIL